MKSAVLLVLENNKLPKIKIKINSLFYFKKVIINVSCLKIKEKKFRFISKVLIKHLIKRKEMSVLNIREQGKE